MSLDCAALLTIIQSRWHMLFLAIPVTTMYLGVWQARKVMWKTQLVEDLKNNSTRTAPILPSTCVCQMSEYRGATLMIL